MVLICILIFLCTILQVLHYIKIKDKERVSSAITRAIAAYDIQSSDMKNYLDLSNVRY
jgi:hypothetical protein